MVGVLIIILLLVSEKALRWHPAKEQFSSVTSAKQGKQWVTYLPTAWSSCPEFQAFGGACSSTNSNSSSNSQLLFSSYRDAGVLGVVEADLRLLLRTNLALVGGSSSLGTHS